MNKPFATTEQYRSELLRLGEMAHAREPNDILRRHYDAFCANEDASDEIFPTFGSFRKALGLEYAEAMCVVMWLYLDASPLQALSAGELLERCRRLGNAPPRQVMSRIFVAVNERITLHPMAIDFLFEREPRLPEGVELTIPVEDELRHTKPLFDELSSLLDAYVAEEHPFPMEIVICGDKGSGRSLLVSRLCLRFGATLLKVNCQAGPDTEDILLAAAIYGSIICAEHPQKHEQIGELAVRAGFVVVLCDREQRIPESADYAIFKRNMPEPDMESREKLLASILGNSAPELDSAMRNGLHRLNIGQTKQLALRLKVESMAAGKPVDKQIFLRVLREQAPSRITGAVRLECTEALRDLILPHELMRQLTELCSFVEKRDTVYKSWGFNKKISWGRGISALFYGAPGTGKTMAAAVLANETGLPLLRVDISQLISKYIGETQKNIGQIFEQAAGANGILFFDEADAIFSKRTESADAQDKYANAETAYLLQRMEGYEGVCVLATNLLQNFDEAFRRRISYMLHFPLPDAAMREKIWRGVFPAKAPVAELDYTLLAQQLELSGASIKNCAVHGAYLAAVNGTAITMEYIIAGAKNEYQKQGKTMSPQALQILSV